jgi:hypothetical protein
MDNLPLPKAIENFIAATNAHDANALTALFADGATGRDDGKKYSGEDVFREWILGHLINPQIVITPTSFADDRLVPPETVTSPAGPCPSRSSSASETTRSPTSRSTPSDPSPAGTGSGGARWVPPLHLWRRLGSRMRAIIDAAWRRLRRRVMATPN